MSSGWSFLKPASSHPVSGKGSQTRGAFESAEAFQARQKANKVAAKRASDHASRANVSVAPPRESQPSPPAAGGNTDSDKKQDDVRAVSNPFVVPDHLRGPTWGMTLMQKAAYGASLKEEGGASHVLLVKMASNHKAIVTLLTKTVDAADIVHKFILGGRMYVGFKGGQHNVRASIAAAEPGGLRYGLQQGAHGFGVGASNASAAAAEPGGIRYGLQQGASGAGVDSSNNFANFLDQFPEHMMVVTDISSRSRSVLSLRDGLDFYTKKVVEKQSGKHGDRSMIKIMLDGQQIQSHGFIYTIELRASSSSNNASASPASDLSTTPTSTLSSSAVGPSSVPSVVVGPWYLVNNLAPPFVNEPRTSTSDAVTGILTTHRGALTATGYQILHQLKIDPQVKEIHKTKEFAFGLLEKNKPGRVFSDVKVLIEEAMRICKNKGVFNSQQLHSVDRVKKYLLTNVNHFSKLLDTVFIFVAHQGVGPTRAKQMSNGVITKSGAYRSKSKKSKSKSSRKSSKSSKVKTSSSSSAKAGSKRQRDEEDDEGDDDDDDDDDDDEEDDEEDDDDDSAVIISIDD